MQEYKIADFRADYPDEHFPRYEVLGKDDLDGILRVIREKLGADTNATPSELVTTIDERAKIIVGMNADAEGFCLEAVFHAMRIIPPATVLINWSGFEQVDRMRFDDVSKYFWDLWYPGADDIDIVDEGFSWIVSIANDGYIRLLRFASKQ